MIVLSSLDQDAQAAAESAGVRVALLSRARDMAEASRLLGEVWQMEPPRSPVEPAFLIGLAEAGGYVAAAHRGNQMVGVCVGFFRPPQDLSLHSQIAGVSGGAAGRGVGRALKYHQRAWAASVGLREIAWTFDPLIARNAFFNIHRLGCEVSAYLPDFYGPMADGVNGGTLSDRLLVSWSVSDAQPRPDIADLPAPALRRAGARPEVCPVPADVSTLRVEVPEDSEQLRATAPALAHEWRLAIRTILSELQAGGWRIADFDRRGFYRFTREAS